MIASKAPSFTSICRVCMSGEHELVLIFDEKYSVDGETFASILSECTQFKVERSDELPHYICKGCMDSARTAFRFKRNCELSYRILGNLLKSKKISARSSIDYYRQIKGTNDAPHVAVKSSDQSLTELNSKPQQSEDLYCPFCRKIFDSPTGLKAHVLEKHPDINAEKSCIVCSPLFTEKEGLCMHLQLLSETVDGGSLGEATQRNSNCLYLEGSNRSVSEPEFSFEAVEANYGNAVNDSTESGENPLNTIENARRVVVKSEMDFAMEADYSTDNDEMVTDECNRKDAMGNFIGEQILEKKCVKKSGTTYSEVFPCTECPATYFRLYHLQRHMRTHSEEKPFACTECSKRFARKDHLKNHERCCQKEHKCEECAIVFQREFLLTKHKVETHGYEPPEKKMHACEECDKKFSTKPNLIKHRQIHSVRSYSCKYCELLFHDRLVLREHVKTHEGISGFLCFVCGESFQRNDYLKVHMRRHNGEKPYKCKYCDKGFPRSTDLKMHERYHTGTKPYACDTCDKHFHRLYNLNLHIRTHTGERPYKCDHCPKSFTQKNDLKAHIRRHTGERYKCEECSAGFLQLYALRQHAFTEHGIHIQPTTSRLKKMSPSLAAPLSKTELSSA